jgi:RimJ/RimL family protein N-acetyltransferase
MGMSTCLVNRVAILRDSREFTPLNSGDRRHQLVKSAAHFMAALVYTIGMIRESTLQFRKIKKSDELIFARWWRDRRLVYFTSGAAVNLTDNKIHRYFETMRHSRRADHWMIERRLKIIGHVSILKTGTWPEVQIVIGDYKNWGHGYGSQIGTWLMKQARRHKINTAIMHVWVNNRRSIALGKKFGFKPVRIVRRRMGNRYRDYWLMKTVLK